MVNKLRNGGWYRGAFRKAPEYYVGPLPGDNRYSYKRFRLELFHSPRRRPEFLQGGPFGLGVKFLILEH